jgi:hypothetical protein
MARPVLVLSHAMAKFSLHFQLRLRASFKHLNSYISPLCKQNKTPFNLMNAMDKSESESKNVINIDLPEKVARVIVS